MVVKIASASAGCCPVRLKVNVSPRGRVQVICLTYMFGQSYQVSGICCHLIGSFSAGRTQSTVHDFAAARFTEVTSHSGSVSSSLTNSFPPPSSYPFCFTFSISPSGLSLSLSAASFPSTPCVYVYTACGNLL